MWGDQQSFRFVSAAQHNALRRMRHFFWRFLHTERLLLIYNIQFYDLYSCGEAFESQHPTRIATKSLKKQYGFKWGNKKNVTDKVVRGRDEK